MNETNTPLPLGVVGALHRPALRPLTDEERQFEIDQCIGCNRCMQACPIPLSSQVKIADLNEATVGSTVLPHVAEFATACVLCGLCVPVCPVGDHRDLLMVALKARVGHPWDRPCDLSRLQAQLPTGWTSEDVLERLACLSFLALAPSLPKQYLWHMLASSTVRAYAPGTAIIREGETGHSLYAMLDGTCDLSAQGPGGRPLVLAVARVGDYFGEQGFLTGQVRTLTATATSQAVVIEIPEPVLHTLQETVPAVRDAFLRLSARTSVKAQFTKLALFAGVEADDLTSLAQAAHIHYYERGHLLFAEHTASSRPSVLQLILDGFVKVSRGTERAGERILAYRQTGDYFLAGLDLCGDGSSVTVTTITRTSVVELSLEMLAPLFTQYPNLRARFEERGHGYRATALAAQTTAMRALGKEPEKGKAARASLRALVADGVVEGNEVLVIDLDRCVHCDECVDACARRHGRSRLNRTGMVIGNISVVTACRQCQDPVCLLCSRAGIARLPSGEVYITENCIGCGICAERCPYDNIEIVSLAEAVPAPSRSVWERFSRLITKGAGKEFGRPRLPMYTGAATPPLLDVQNPPTDAYGNLVKMVATKCDLCAGYQNQACVVACPTGAVLRTRPTTFFGSTEQILGERPRP